MRTTGKKRAIRNAFFRLGLHARPKAVVQAWMQQGAQVDEELLRQVRIEMLKETTGARLSKVSRPVPSPVLRRPRDFRSCSERGQQCLPHPERLEAMMVEGMKAAGLDPAFIYAFEQTGLLVTEQNQHLILEKDLAEWGAAIGEYERKHGRTG